MNIKAYLYTIPIVVLLLAMPALADEYIYNYDGTTEEQIRNGWQSILEFLPEEIRDEAEQLDPIHGNGIRERTGFRYWIGQILIGLSGGIHEIIPKTLTLFSVIVLIAIVELSMETSPEKGLTKCSSMLSNLVAAVILFRMTDGILIGAKEYLDRICGLMSLMASVMEVLYLAGGSLTQKIVTAEAVMLGITLIGAFSGQILVPLTNLLFTLTCLDGVCDDVRISGFVGGLRKWMMRIWQYSTILYSFILSIQSILAKSADSLAARTARFAIGTFIPVAGGVLAETFTTVKEGVNLLRSTVGVGGILLILLLLIPGIIPLILYKSVLAMAETAANGMNLGKIRGMLAEVHGIVDLLLGFVLNTSLMFLLVMILFAKTQAGL